MKMFEMYKKNDGTPYLKTIVDYDNKYIARTPADAINNIRDVYGMDNMESEHHLVVGFDEDKDIIGFYCDAIGDYDSVNIYLRKVALAALLMGAKYFMTIHNHPNNNMVSTIEDMQIQANISKMADVIQIEYFGEYLVSICGWKRVGENNHTEWRN